MAAEKTKNIIVYNKNQDSLFVSKGRATYASIDIDDFIFDFDKEGFLVALEIEEASKNIGLPKEQLESIEYISLNATYKPNLVKIVLIFKFRNEQKEIIVPLYADLGHSKIVTQSTTFASATA
jgi:hypothetical protein